MAVVFISPKQRQKMFFTGITAAFLLLILIVSLSVFFAKPKDISPALVFNAPKVDINMDVFSSDQFKNLQPFGDMEIQYVYKAVNEENEQETGMIMAVSLEKAKDILEGIGLRVTELKEADIGRENPFTPYYQIIPSPEPAPVPRARR